MHRLVSNTRVALATGVAAFACASTAFAQSFAEAPEQAPQFVETAPLEIPETDETQLNLSAGGVLNTGNTRAFQANVGGDFRMVRGDSAFGANTGFVYGRADLPEDETDDYQDTSRNLNARARYDYFVTTMDAIFAAGVYRWDTFAGLDTRLQGQLGYLRNFIVKEEAMRFWGEVGYDITYDNYTQEVLDDLADMGEPVEEETVVHSGRLFFGYDNHLNELVTVLIGLEGLLNVERPEDFRLNWDNALRSKLNGSLQLEVKFSLKFDSEPVPGTRKVDTMTQVNLIYTLL